MVFGTEKLTNETWIKNGWKNEWMNDRKKDVKIP